MQAYGTTPLEHGQQTIQSAVSLAEIALQEGNLKKVIDYTWQVLPRTLKTLMPYGRALQALLRW